MKMRRFGRAVWATAGMLCLLALGAMVARADTEPTAGSTYLFAHLHARSHSLDAIWIERSLAEMVPSQQFSINGGPAASRTAALVIGKVADVRPGKGFSHKDDAPSSTEVGFNSPSR